MIISESKLSTWKLGAPLALAAFMGPRTTKYVGALLISVVENFHCILENFIHEKVYLM